MRYFFILLVALIGASTPGWSEESKEGADIPATHPFTVEAQLFVGFAAGFNALGEVDVGEATRVEIAIGAYAPLDGPPEPGTNYLSSRFLSARGRRSWLSPSFIVFGGLGVLEERYDRFDSGHGLTTDTPDERWKESSEMVDLGVGNAWQVGYERHFILGCDWLEVFLPFGPKGGETPQRRGQWADVYNLRGPSFRAGYSF